MICDAGEDLKMFEVVQLEHVVREANYAVNLMANRGHETDSLSYWFEFPDVSFSVIIYRDTLGVPSSWYPP